MRSPRELLQLVSHCNGQPGRVCHPVATVGPAFYFTIVDKEIETIQIVDSTTDSFEIGTKKHNYLFPALVLQPGRVRRLRAFIVSRDWLSPFIEQGAKAIVRRKLSEIEKQFD